MPSSALKTNNNFQVTGSFIYLHCTEDSLGLQDANLKHTLQFGIGLHHAGLDERDRKMVERLFVEQKIQVRHRPSH